MKLNLLKNVIILYPKLDFRRAPHKSQERPPFRVFFQRPTDRGNFPPTRPVPPTESQPNARQGKSNVARSYQHKGNHIWQLNKGETASRAVREYQPLS